mgnify:CR=1 FL=1|jgi:hypothetical protein
MTMILDERHQPVQIVLDQVIESAKPEAVFLYNCKYYWGGELTSFKLCVICDCSDKRRLLSEIFDVDCEIPFDILLYTKEQFDEFKDNPSAFAHRIFTKGTMLYGNE